MSVETPRSLHQALLAALTALLVAAPLAAGDSGWYLVGKVGQASAELELGPRFFGFGIDDDDTAAGFAVGYSVLPVLAFEAGYHDLGSFPGEPLPCPPGELCPLFLLPVQPLELEVKGFSLAAVPRWLLTERISLHGKLGVLDWDGKLVRGRGTPYVEEPSDRELLAGIGAEYALPLGLGVRLEYEKSDLIEAVSLGASWRF